MTVDEVVCEQDGTPTRLRCSSCSKPICVKCMVRTSVGQKCLACTGLETAQRRRQRPKWALPVLAVVVVAAGLVATRMSGGGGHQDTTTVSAVPSTEAGSATGPDAALGERVRAGALSLVVSSWQCVGKDIGSPPVATALGRFCAMQYSVRNDGNGVATFIFSALAVVDPQGKRYVSDASISRAYSAQLFPTTGSVPATAPGGTPIVPAARQLNPGIELTGALVFDIPESVTPAAAVFGSTRGFAGVRIRLAS